MLASLLGCVVLLPFGCPASAQMAGNGAAVRSGPLPPRRPADLPVRPQRPGVPPPAAADGATARPENPAPPAVTPGDGEASCLDGLRAVPGNRVEAADPKLARGDPACRVSEPVIVEALALRTPGTARVVAFQPPVTLSCPMAKAVAGWLDDSVQPLARGYFDSDLAGLRVGGGHECRRRNRAAAGPVSEHATGKALDIFSFGLGDGKAAVEVVVEKPAGLAQSRFLTAVRQSACGAFATALGPGSDAAHANHLHVDIQERRSRAARFCQ